MSELLNEKMSVDPNSLTGMRSNTFGGPNRLMKPRKPVRRVDNIGDDTTTDVMIEETEPGFDAIVERLRGLVKKGDREYKLSEIRKYIQGVTAMLVSPKKTAVPADEVRLLKYLVTVGQYLEKNVNGVKSNYNFQQALAQLAQVLQGKD